MDNYVARFSTLAHSITDIERIVEHVARKITLAKQNDILNPSKDDIKKGYLQRSYDAILKVKNKAEALIYLNRYETEAKKLAVEDAGTLLERIDVAMKAKVLDPNA